MKLFNRECPGGCGLPSRVKEALEGAGSWLDRASTQLNAWADRGFVGRWFGFKERGAKFTVECRAGFITFLMVSYALAVIPNILVTTGGTCEPEVVCTNYKTLGPACLGDAEDPGAQDCLESLKADLITAVAASSLVSCFLIGCMANLPLGLAPGVGITAYMAYQVVGQYGQGQLTYSQAMTAVFVEGWIFLALSVTGVRGGLVKYMPKSIALASSVGIGLLLAFTGLHNLGAIAFSQNTFVGIGGCDQTHQTYIYSFNQPLNTTQMLESLNNVTHRVNVTASLGEGVFMPIPAAVHGCAGYTMRSASMWLGIAGGVLMAILLFAGVKGSLIMGILFVTVISWIPNHAASYLGANSPIEGGEYRMETFKKVVAAPSLSLTGFSWDWSAFGNGHLWLALFTFLYIDLLDCTGTLLSMARLMDYMLPGFMNENMEFPGQMWAYLSDGLGILGASMMGSTSLTVYIESAAGIEDGGRTGLTAIVVSFFFFIALFFSPILASIPPYATGPALVLVGSILLGHTAFISWDDVGQAVPAFLTIIIMPFTYSVAYGVIAGLASYVLIHLPFWLWDMLLAKLRKTNGAAGTEEESYRACISRGRFHRKMYPGHGGSSDNLANMTIRSAQELSLYGEPSICGTVYGEPSVYGTAIHGANGGGRPQLRRGSAAALGAGPAWGLKPVVSHGSLQNELPAINRSSGGLPMFRRSLTGLPPGRSPSSLSGVHSMDSAWAPAGSRPGSAGVSRRSSDYPELEPVPAPPMGGALPRVASQGTDPSASGSRGYLLPSPRLTSSRAPSGSMHRSNSFSHHSGSAAGLYPSEDLERRESLSCHGGGAYAEYASQLAQHSGGSPSQDSLQGRDASLLHPGESLGQRPVGYARSSSAPAEASLGPSSSGSPGQAPGGVSFTFSGGRFRMVRGGSIGSGSSGELDLAYGAGGGGYPTGGQAGRFFRRSMTMPADNLGRQSAGGSWEGASGGSGEVVPQPLRAQSQRGVGSRSLFQLFGGSDAPGEVEAEGGEQQQGAGGGGVFKLFGDVELAEEDLEAEGEGQQPSSSFKLFGDVQLPPEALEEEGEGQQPSSSFKLFGDVQLPPEAFEEEGEGAAAEEGAQAAGVEGQRTGGREGEAGGGCVSGAAEQAKSEGGADE